MKTKQLLFSFLVLFVCTNLNAQLLFEENFNYTAENALVSNPVASSTNTDATTGWSTISGTNSNTNSFNITAEGLSYPNYASSGIGKALKVLDNNGQDVYKLFCGANLIPTAGAPYTGPKTIYLSTLINVPAGDKTGFEFIMGLKTDLTTTSTQVVRGRLSVKVTGDNVQFGVGKAAVFSATSPASVWSSNYAVNTTHLLVIKYTMTGAAASLAEETGKYDDIVDLYVNPTIGTSEPTTATLSYAAASETDAYRWNSGGTAIIGGMAGVYFRTPTAGSIPEATFDGIRIGETWESVVKLASGVATVNQNSFKIFRDNTKQLQVKLTDTSFNKYQIYAANGQKMAEENIDDSNFSINTNSFSKGLYIISLKNGNSSQSAKFIVQ